MLQKIFSMFFRLLFGPPIPTGPIPEAVMDLLRMVDAAGGDIVFDDGGVPDGTTRETVNVAIARKLLRRSDGSAWEAQDGLMLTRRGREALRAAESPSA
jgi:hypothetical protein